MSLSVVLRAGLSSADPTKVTLLHSAFSNTNYELQQTKKQTKKQTYKTMCDSIVFSVEPH